MVDPFTLDDPLAKAIYEAFTALGGVQPSGSIVAWINDRKLGHWSEIKIRNHIRGCSVNYPKAISYDPSLPRFLFRISHGVYRIYDENSDGPFDSKGLRADETSTSSDTVDELRELTEEIESRNEFAYEAHLRDYLARNLNILEGGLSLWSANSIEYPVEGRRIDILARDRDGVPVIIELKLSRGHERTIGQALYYRGKLRQLLGVTRVRIIMVAGEISEELRVASGEVVDVDLFSYALTMQVQKVMKHPVA